MKHDLNITLLLILLFLSAQFIGLFVIWPYIVSEKPLPYNIERPQLEETTSFIWIAAVIGIGTLIAFFLAKMETPSLWKAWFFVSVVFTLSIAFSSFINQFIAFGIAAVLAVLKVFKRNVYIHNFTELFIYGGLAAILTPLLSIISISILLVIISIYDYIAVRKTKHMIVLAKFQTKMKVFAGFLIPYGKGKEAILGGGDVGFPLMFTGVAAKTLGFNALVIPIFAALALLFLFIKSEKKKFYPAMPILSVGCFAGYLVAYLLNYYHVFF